MDELDIIRGFDLAMRNSYNIIVGDKEVEDMVINNQVLFAHDIDAGPSDDEINEIIKYFADIDEFEKCIELKKIKEDGNSN
tara:strand:+ start:1927 stop:2169 length:243 start_codon:yes stop_codon:yes gene_type:complete